MCSKVWLFTACAVAMPRRKPMHLAVPHQQRPVHVAMAEVEPDRTAALAATKRQSRTAPELFE